MGERLLVDGYVLNNLPIEAARALGAEIVIAVDVSTPMLKREQLASITGIASQALSLSAQRRVDAQKRDADILLEPELAGVSLLDFRAEPSLGSDLREQYFGVARLGYLYRLAELPDLLGSAIYLGGWVEGGNVWQTSDALGEDLIYTAALAVAAETRLGTLFFGYGVADDRKDSYFLTLGQRF